MDTYKTGDKVLTCQVGWEVNARRGTVVKRQNDTRLPVDQEWYTVHDEDGGGGTYHISWLHRIKDGSDVQLDQSVLADLKAAIAAVPVKVHDLPSMPGKYFTLGQAIHSTLWEGQDLSNAPIEAHIEHDIQAHRIMHTLAVAVLGVLASKLKN